MTDEDRITGDDIPELPPLPPGASPATRAAYAEAVENRNHMVDLLNASPRKRPPPRDQHWIDNPEFDIMTVGTRGPLPGSNVDDAEVQAKIDEVIRGRPYLLWIEGEARVNDGDVIVDSIGRPLPDPRIGWADDITILATKLNLRVYRRYFDFGTTPVPDALPKRRTWTNKRVAIDDIEALVIYNPGIQYETVRDLLYKAEPWDDASKKAADSKFRVALYRMRKNSRGVVTRYNSEGKPCLFMAHTPSRFSKQRNARFADPSFIRPHPVSHEETIAVATYLKEMFNTTTFEDPSTWTDIAREALVKAAAIATSPQPALPEVEIRQPPGYEEP